MTAPYSNPFGRTLLLSLATLLMLPGCNDDPVPVVRAFQVEHRDQVIGGPAAVLDVGDFIIENDRIRVGILGATTAAGNPAYSMGPGLYAGSIVDMDLQRPEAEFQNGHGLDQLAENFPTVNLKIPATEVVEVIEDGSNGSARIRMRGPGASYFSLLDLLDYLCVPGSNGQIFTDYILEPGKNYIKLATTVMMDKFDAPIGETDVHPDMVTPGANVMPVLKTSTPVVDYYQKGGLIVGDFFLLGGNVNIFAPGVGFDEDGAVDDTPNTLVHPFAFDFIAAVGDRISYGFVALPEGKAITPLFSASMTATFAGALDEPEWEGRTNYTLERYLIVGEGDVASIVDTMLEIHGTDYGTVRGNVWDKSTGEALSKVHVFVYHDPRAEGDESTLTMADLTRDLMYSEFLTDRGNDKRLDGSFQGNLPKGRYVLMAKDEVRGISALVPINVGVGDTIQVGIEAAGTGNFSFSVRDQNGKRLPSKLTFREANGAFRAEPMLGESRLSNGYSLVYFSPSGEETIQLRPGNYQVMVSRGLEYSLYDTANDETFPDGFIAVPAGGRGNTSVHLDVVLEREVDTTGYIAGDFHVHATNSHDSGVSLEMRALTMAAEGVEFMASTDHDYITNYGPIIREMGLTEWLNSAIGLEVTTVELGHMLGFPLEYRADKRAGGAVDWSFMTPSEMIQGLKAKGLNGPDETVTVVAHPRDGILGYFDVYGYNPWTNVVDPQTDVDFAIRDLADLNLYLELLRINPLFDHKLFTLDFDSLEILNGKRMDLIRSATWEEMQDMQDHAVFDEDSQSYIFDEMTDPLTGEVQPGEIWWMYHIIERTMEEQVLLDAGESGGGYGLNVGHRRGQMEDWFNLLNYGYTISGIGNSDTHGTTSVEAGCPRTYVRSSSDEPAFIDPQEVAQSVRDSQAIATYGPFIDVIANGQYTIGDTLSTLSTAGQLQLDIRIQAASWIQVKRVELYENGRLIEEMAVDPDSRDIQRFTRTINLAPEKDSWYVVMAMSDQDLSPVFNKVELPYIELDAIIEEALISLNNKNCAGLFGAPPAFPSRYPVFPFGFTNPIWVDVDGDVDGDGKLFEAPGHADWMRLDEREVITPQDDGRPMRTSFGLILHH